MWIFKTIRYRKEQGVHTLNNKNTTSLIITVCRHTRTLILSYFHVYGTLNHETTFRRYYRDTVAYIHMVSLNGWGVYASCAPQMAMGVRWGTTGKYGGTFLSWGKGVREDFSFLRPFPFFMTDSRTSSAKNPGAWGSSRWCRACQEKTWGTCNPEGDLESAISNKKVNCKLRSTCTSCMHSVLLKSNDLLVSGKAHFVLNSWSRESPPWSFNLYRDESAIHRWFISEEVATQSLWRCRG